MTACSIQPWIMIGIALAFILFVASTTPASYRQIAETYVKQWGVDAATVAQVRARRGGRLNAILTYVVMGPFLVFAIGVAAFGLSESLTGAPACAAPFSFFPTMAAILTVMVYYFPFLFAGMALVTFLTPATVAYRRGLKGLRREDLPVHPTIADFEAAVPTPDPAALLRTRLISLAVCVAGVAVLVWLTTSQASDVISDFVIPHRATPVQAAAIHNGLSHVLPWLQIGLFVISVPYGGYIWWALLTGERRAYRRLGAKWSMPPADIRRLVKSRRGIGYRVLRMIWFGTMFLVFAGAICVMATPPKQTAEIVTIGMLLASSFAFSTGLLVACYAQGSAYARALLHALQTQDPTSNVSASTIVTGIDHKAIADQARTTRIAGLVIIFLAMIFTFGVLRTPGTVDHLAHILPWR